MPTLQIINILQEVSPIYLLIFTALFAFLFINLLFFIFGKSGLYVYMIIGTIIPNVQVLKTVHFFFLNHPVALGTALFGTTYLCTDILAECYGKKAASKAVFMAFFCFLFWSIYMVLTAGFAAQKSSSQIGIQSSLVTLFSPSMRFFLAAMIAYLISQLHDVWLFSFIKAITRNKLLWLRNTLSTCVSAFIDNCIFSFLAWYLFNPDPLSFNIIFFTYILGTYIVRVAIAIADTPFMYLARTINKIKTT